MRLKSVLFAMLILTALFLSAYGAPAPHDAKFQATATVPSVTLVVPSVVAVGTPVVITPGVIPVTGTGDTGIWTIVLFGLLALLGIAFLVALFSPRTTQEHIDRNPPAPPP
ncbi:MAG TPA: hypothetical protein VK249_00870 [Anaerolineales bacterium]|nr:hypothetical protein [Anaerolineales bacterium]